MVLFLNLAPSLLVIIGALVMIFFFIKRKILHMFGTSVVVLVLAFLLQAISPSYLPKGMAGVPESLPEWEETEARIEDRLRKPAPDHEEVLEEDLDWKEQVEQEKNKTESN